MTNPSIYTVGGTVQAGGGVYIKRKADDELLDLCRQGEFAFILSPRQVGKSSLMVRTAQQLEKENIRSIIIDLSAIGVNVSVDEWYLGILNEVTNTLNLDIDIFSWWGQFSQLGAAQRLTNFFKDVVLKELNERIVLFFDEIDSTLSIHFSDDFYIALRAAYNARSTTPEFKRLSFVLVGVAAPSDLISDNNRTPFNIGRRVDLNDFTLTEAFPLAQGFGEHAVETLTWVFQYTNGHPYLTQRLCAHLAKLNVSLNEQTVADSVKQLFTGEEGRQDNNLQFVRDMLSKRSPDVARVMQIYRDIRSGKRIRDDERSISKAHLKLSGLVRSENGILRIRNEIYNRIFNLRWVHENTPNNWTKIAAFSFGIVSFILLFIFILNYVVDNNVTRKVVEFGNTRDPSIKLEYLAQIFDTKGILPNTDYDSRARELFFSLPAKDQIDLFAGASAESKNKYLPTVVRGLYVTMAIVNGGQDSTDLLTIIEDSLGDVDNKSNLYREIDLWLQARNAISDEDSLSRYNEAINLNSENPSLFYERAVVEIRLGQYGQALSDLDTTMGLAQLLSSEDSEESNVTPNQSPAATDTLPDLLTSTSPSAADKATLAAILSSASTQLSATQKATATLTNGDLTPTPTQDNAPTFGESYRSSFSSQAYIRSAVDLVIQENLKTSNFQTLLTETTKYPNLASNGLLSSNETPTKPSASTIASPESTPPVLTPTVPARAVTPTSILGLPTLIPTPNGGADQIALLSGNNILSMNLDGASLISIDNENYEKSNLQWLADGRLVYISPSRNCAYLVDVEKNEGSSEIICFNVAEKLEGFRVSPNGLYVAISVDGVLYIVPFDVEQLKRIDTRFLLDKMENGCSYNVPVKDVRWSRDGSRIAALVADTQQGLSDQIHLFNVSPGNCNSQTLVATDKFPATRFTFSSTTIESYDWDGGHLFLLNDNKRNGGFGDLYLYDGESHVGLLINPIDGSCCYRDARWSPDGGYVLFLYQNVLGIEIKLYYIPTDALAANETWTPIEILPDLFKPRDNPQPALRPVQ